MKIKAKNIIHNHMLDIHDNQNLLQDKTYEVIGIYPDYFRVINEVGEPILYPRYLFDIIDSHIPESWIRRDYGPDEYYIDPQELSQPGFYEDYFNGELAAKLALEKYLASVGLGRKNP